MDGRQPTLTVLACRYCGSVPVELAGIRRLEYPATVKVIDVPCAGTIEPRHLLAAFEQGADGVLVVACPSGGCHHLDGERRADRRTAYARAALAEAGLDPDRLRIVHMGIGQAGSFAETVRTMCASIARRLEPASLPEAAQGGPAQGATPPAG
jgi:F420-non-reducing hydrogenase iron-sulfur subunit